MKYMISHEQDPGTWAIDLEHFEAGLRRLWPASVVVRSSDPDAYRQLVWHAQMDHGAVEGAVVGGRQVLTIEGEIDDCAAVACWFRNAMPIQGKLVFYDEGFNRDVELTAETTAAEIVAAFVD